VIHATFQTAPDADAARREKARAHFAWQQGVAERSDLSPTVRLAAWALARRRNVLSGRCDPSYADIAKGMGAASPRSAIRAVAALERAGLVVVDRRVGRGHRNQVTFIMPEKVTQPSQGFSAGKGDKPGAGKPLDEPIKGDKPAPEKVTKLCHPNKERAPIEPSQHGERECARAREASQSGARASDGPAPDLTTKSAADRPTAKTERGREGVGPTVRAKANSKIEGGYLELQQVWAVRGWIDDHTEGWRAYAAAVSEASPSAILAGAQRWVREINDPQFLPALPKWIKDQGWRKSPRKYYQPRQEKPPGSSAARRHGGKPDLAKIALLAGGYVELADGSVVWPEP
jgi:hypothetical protein